jgi:hypothetical protein
MGTYLRIGAATTLLTCVLAAVYGLAQPVKAAAGERMIFVDPPLRTISQCMLAAIRETVLVCRERGAVRLVRLSRDAVVWKGSDQRGTAALRPGDLLDIKLQLDPATQREVGTFVWANLVKREGTVRRWEPSRFFLSGGAGQRQTEVLLDGETEFLQGRSSDTAPKPGSAAIVIGLRLDRNTVKATRVLFAR